MNRSEPKNGEGTGARAALSFVAPEISGLSQKEDARKSLV